jgi:hypothetical protein
VQYSHQALTLVLPPCLPPYPICCCIFKAVVEEAGGQGGRTHLHQRQGPVVSL